MDAPFIIHVDTQYLGKQDKPDQADVFVFSYTVSIKNVGLDPMQLVSRHWLITNGDGEQVEVKGEGVVGEQPVIEPNQTYSYTSASMLKTKVGTMEGFYSFKANDDTEVTAPIPLFSLVVPNSLH